MIRARLNDVWVEIIANIDYGQEQTFDQPEIPPSVEIADIIVSDTVSIITIIHEVNIKEIEDYIFKEIDSGRASGLYNECHYIYPDTSIGEL